MPCLRCGHENPPEARFCNGCGAKLDVRCASCGQSNPAGSRFCNSCGQSLGDAPGRTRPPESYIPKHLAERILTSKGALEGERKQVTVLFADLKGSMELLADRDPEEARKILDPVLEHMMEAVHRYEGTVNQVMGDGIMALFGAPIAHEDHALRACYAALRMQETVKKYAEGVRREEGVSVRIRVGLNSGEVVVRAIGSDLHMDYTAVGQTTHLAARMEQLAEPGTAMLTSATLGLCEDFVRVKSLGPMRAKGLAEPIEAYELTGANPMRSRFQAHAARGLTKFVGRASELAQLDEALALARGGRGQVTAVVGEPGVGKSRLFWEFAHSHRTNGCLVVEAASVSYGKATTYLPLIELLRGYFQIEPRDDTRKMREKVTGKLFSLDRAMEPALQPLLALLDVPSDDNEWTRLAPPHRRLRTLDALKRLLLRESQVQPLVVVFEDLHWIDGETQAVLDSLIESLPAARLLLLVNYRPEYQHGWGRKTYYRQLRIDSLPTESLEQLLETLLGTDLSLASLKRLLITRTEGNPFFLEESVRTLVETKVLAGEVGTYRLTRSPDALQIPATARAILAARIDRLEPDDKRLLQAASVIGKDVPLALLEAIVGMPEEALRRGLARLQAAEFLYETKLFPEVEYTFKHALTHEVTYSTILQERRRVLHAHIVEAIERRYSDRLTEHVDRLGHHALRGDLWDRAVQYLRDAGLKALARSALRDADQYFEQALVALEHLPDSRARDERAIDLRFEVRSALLPQGEWDRIVDHMKTAESIAYRLGDLTRQGQIGTYLCTHFWVVSDHENAIAAGERAAKCGDIGLEAVGRIYLSYTYYALGELARGVELLESAIAALGSLPPEERIGQFVAPSVVARTFLAVQLAELGTFERAIASARDAVAIAEKSAYAPNRLVAYWGLGLAHVRRGDYEEATTELERSVAICREMQIPTYLHLVGPALGSAYIATSRLLEAIGFLNEILNDPATQMMMVHRGHALSALSEAHLRSGDVGKALSAAQQAHAIVQEKKQRGHEPWISRLLGDITARSAQPDVGTVEMHYKKSLVLATELGMRPLVAHCHAGLAKFYRRVGKRAESDEQFAAATEMYREMGMTYWLARIEHE